jgi:hypothetical protein
MKRSFILAAALLWAAGAAGQTSQWVLSSEPTQPMNASGPGLSGTAMPTISAAPQPKCPADYTLLTYPGTAIAVCARDLRAPE